MRNIHDWCVSRQLWWGHQIPAWYCEACTPAHADRRDRSRRARRPSSPARPPESCPKCEGSAAGAGPGRAGHLVQLGALAVLARSAGRSRRPELETFYPTSVMETGHDIIFFWVARMMMMGLHFMGDVPFRTVYLHAMVRDEKGEKMSKAKGNVDRSPRRHPRRRRPRSFPRACATSSPKGCRRSALTRCASRSPRSPQQGRDIKLSLDRVDGLQGVRQQAVERLSVPPAEPRRLPPGEPGAA